jgi:hypothetical protein
VSARETTLGVVLAVLLPALAPAQDYSLDVRRIGLGGAGDRQTIALVPTADRAPHKSVVLPLGLLQAFAHRDLFDPDSPSFDPVAAVEYAATPVHYTFARARRPVTSHPDELSPSSSAVHGLAAPNWGRRFAAGSLGRFRHHLYAGAGPYLAASAETDVDADDVAIAAAQRVSVQSAIALTAGYGTHVALWQGAYGEDPRDGVYFAARYHHLEGVRLDRLVSDFRIQLDSDGLPVSGPGTVATAALTHVWGGRGRAVDLASAVVVNGWEVGGGVNGVANHIEWRTTGERLRLSLPRQYTANVAHHADSWTLLAAWSGRLGNDDFAAGVERRVGRVNLRTGVRYALGRVHPAAGIGYAWTNETGIDVAVFRSTAVLGDVDRVALAISLRYRLADRPRNAERRTDARPSPQRRSPGR